MTIIWDSLACWCTIIDEVIVAVVGEFRHCRGTQLDKQSEYDWESGIVKLV